MAARVERGDLTTIARNLGRAGRPLPDQLAADPAAVAAYDQGLAAGGHPLIDRPARRASAPTPQSDPAPTPRAGSRGTGGGGRGFTMPSVRRVTTGDGGGLLLAFVLYPIAISLLKYGAAGPGVWFRAKWLNQTPSQPNNLAQPTPAAPPLQTPSGGAAPRPPGWQGPWPPIGSGGTPPASTGVPA